MVSGADGSLIQKGGLMKIVRIMTFILFAVMPLSASAAQSVSVKANTIDELVKMYDVSSCKECHKKIYEEWEQSIHARSLIGTGRTMGTFKRTLSTLKNTFVHSGVKEIKDVKKEHLMPCFKCHLPQIKDADDDVARQIAEAFDKGDKAILGKLSINCLVCHNMKAVIHQWQDGPPQAGIIYGKKDAPHPDGVFKNLKKSPVITKAVSCGQCHGTGPNFEFPQPSQCATAYGSYLHAYIPAGGTETCQDCHMKKNGKGHLMPAYRDTEMRAEAVDVKIDILGYKFLPDRENVIPMAVMTLRITSKAGHRIPDG